MPANSAVRRSVISPQRPRTRCDCNAVTSLLVSVRKAASVSATVRIASYSGPTQNLGRSIYTSKATPRCETAIMSRMIYSQTLGIQNGNPGKDQK